MAQILLGFERKVIEPMGDYGHQNIKIDLDRDRRGKGIEAEELNRFCYTIFNSPSFSVTDDDGVNRNSSVRSQLLTIQFRPC